MAQVRLLDCSNVKNGIQRKVRMRTECLETDILVIGGGLAKAFAAIKAKEVDYAQMKII